MMAFGASFLFMRLVLTQPGHSCYNVSNEEGDCDSEKGSAPVKSNQVYIRLKDRELEELHDGSILIRYDHLPGFTYIYRGEDDLKEDFKMYREYIEQVNERR